jgi:hypothetical protein
MPNGYSRAKGVRGERDIKRRLGGKRVGVAYLSNPVDVDLGWAVAQVKNRSLGGTAIYDALQAMDAVTDKGINKYVIFKPKRGNWLVVETLEQFQGDHGGKIPKEKLSSRP